MFRANVTNVYGTNDLNNSEHFLASPSDAQTGTATGHVARSDPVVDNATQHCVTENNVRFRTSSLRLLAHFLEGVAAPSWRTGIPRFKKILFWVAPDCI